MKEYEALFVIDPEKEKSIKEVALNITGAIAKSAGRVIKEQNWGKQRLAYPIDKRAEGVYYKLDFSAPEKAISNLNNNFKLNADILRVIITAKREK